MHSLLSVNGLDKYPDTLVAARYLTQSLQNIDQHSWIAGIESFPASSTGQIELNKIHRGVVSVSKFWSPTFTAKPALNSDDDIIDELRETMNDAINLRLHADVPVGVALSGGLDSSIIAGLAKSKALSDGENVKLFSAVNPGSIEDESYFIDIMSQYLEVDVERFHLNPKNGEELFELLRVCTSHNDGPLTSFSNLLFYKLMEMAKASNIKVILTGQGADEAFCGYRKYPILEAKRLLKSGNIKESVSLVSGFLKNKTLLSEFRLNEAKRYLGFNNQSILGVSTLEVFAPISLGKINSLEERQWADISQFSVPYLCHYEDRMSMAWSREIRTPFLDYRVVELGLKMKSSLKLKNGWTKYALRQAYSESLPSEITWRKDKKGFVNPQDNWLKEILRDYVLDLMTDKNSKIYQLELVNREKYLTAYKAYCNGSKHIWFRDVFAPFALEIWLRGVDDK
jgi:asparagine synthase (glutamine-hydrolysing)